MPFQTSNIRQFLCYTANGRIQIMLFISLNRNQLQRYSFQMSYYINNFNRITSNKKPLFERGFKTIRLLNFMLSKIVLYLFRKGRAHYY